MRYVQESKRYKKDLKRLGKSASGKIIDKRLPPALDALANDIPLDYSYRDHALTNNWEGYRECHIAFDVILVYAIAGDDLLILNRLGSHAEIFGL